jgi:transcriptional regulator with XRE-family HTH domain
MEDTYRKTLPPDLAKALNLARLENRLTIRDGAKRCGISKSHFGNLIIGKRAPSDRVAIRLIHGLQLDDDLALDLLDHAVHSDW